MDDHRIKLLVLDVDGVLTDGTKCYNSDGEVISKHFCDKDWTAIKRFKAIGIPVVFLTGDKFNEKILQNRNLDVIVCRSAGIHTDKSMYLAELCTRYDCDPDDVCFIGDDLFDIGLMKKVGYPFCVYNAPKIVGDHSKRLLSAGGDNVIARLFDVLEHNKMIPVVPYENIMGKIYALDIKEKF